MTNVHKTKIKIKIKTKSSIDVNKKKNIDKSNNNLNGEFPNKLKQQRSKVKIYDRKDLYNRNQIQLYSNRNGKHNNKRNKNKKNNRKKNNKNNNRNKKGHFQNGGNVRFNFSNSSNNYFVDEFDDFGSAFFDGRRNNRSNSHRSRMRRNNKKHRFGFMY